MRKPAARPPAPLLVRANQALNRPNQGCSLLIRGPRIGVFRRRPSHWSKRGLNVANARVNSSHHVPHLNWSNELRRSGSRNQRTKAEFASQRANLVPPSQRTTRRFLNHVAIRPSLRALARLPSFPSKPTPTTERIFIAHEKPTHPH